MQHFYSLSKELAEAMDIDTTIRGLASADGIAVSSIHEVPAETIPIDEAGRQHYRWFLVTP